ncbi:MAG: anthranilate phosphoribosyltransferase [Acidimicrobiales bacterium]
MPDATATDDTGSDSPPAVAAHGGWPALLGRLVDGEDLSADACAAALGDILADRATDAQIAGLIVGLRQKGETVDEMVGLVAAMLGAAEPLSMPAGTVDIVGTGGSAHRRSHALNVSTMASFVAAAAGAKVCKHGNFKASSTSGSFDFLQSLGVPVGLATEPLERCVAELGLGFALARTFHPAMRFVGPVRAELGIPTVFNVLGPLAHPAQLRRQLIGTASASSAERMAEVLRRNGSELAWVVVGDGGLDEIGLTGPTSVWVVTPDAVTPTTIDPADHDVAVAASLDDLAGGTPAQNVELFQAMWGPEGASGPRTDIVVVNAAAALVVAGQVDDLDAGIEAARAALAGGRVEALVAAISARQD